VTYCTREHLIRSANRETHSPMDRDTRIGIIYIFISTLSFAAYPIFVKFIIEGSDFNPIDIIFWRYAIAIPMMWLLSSLWTRYVEPNKLQRQLPRVRLLLTGILFAAAALTSVFGLQRLDASLYVVLFFTYPAMTGMLAALMGERLPLRGWVALALTMAGIVLTAPEIFSLNLDLGAVSGVLWALLNALVVALYMITVGYVSRGHPTTPLISAYSLTGTALLVLPAVVVAGLQVPDSMRTWLLFLGMGSLGTTVPIFGLTMGITKLGASRAAIVGTLEPAVVILLAYGFLGERLLPVQWAGAILIIISILILEVRLRPRRKPVQNTVRENG
jgi:drug/metabolite transporter (DMT)-like permease